MKPQSALLSSKQKEWLISYVQLAISTVRKKNMVRTVFSVVLEIYCKLISMVMKKTTVVEK